MKFLIVDDSSTMRRTISNSLRELNGVIFKEAENGELALQMLKKEHFDFVLTEFYTPRLNGLGLISAIRTDKNLRHISVLMVTSESKKENVLAAAKAGVDAYIIKPFNTKTLHEKFDIILKKKKNFSDSKDAKAYLKTIHYD